MVPGYDHRMVRPRTEYGPFFQTNSVNISRAGNLAGIKAHPFLPGLFFYRNPPLKTHGLVPWDERGIAR
jgi:hypothetical protein